MSECFLVCRTLGGNYGVPADFPFPTGGAIHINRVTSIFLYREAKHVPVCGFICV